MNRVILGDCRTVMRDLIAEGVRVDCVVTMVEVFGLVRDLLADDGKVAR